MRLRAYAAEDAGNIGQDVAFSIQYIRYNYGFQRQIQILSSHAVSHCALLLPRVSCTIADNKSSLRTRKILGKLLFTFSYLSNSCPSL
jgi:hypothetical protein